MGCKFTFVDVENEAGTDKSLDLAQVIGDLGENYFSSKLITRGSRHIVRYLFYKE